MCKKIVIALLLLVSAVRADWADDELSRMSIQQKVGQIFMPGFRVNKAGDFALMKRLITEYQVGGILLLRTGLGFFGNGQLQTPLEQTQLIQELQQLSTRKLLIAQDLEWGLAQRLCKVVKFPHNMTLGAIKDTTLIYELAKEIGRQCKLMGVHINFAPVVDVNSNPENPVIHDRSFGADIYQVTERALQYMRGLHDAGIISCAKHFPGHGDTAVDSHYDLPVIEHVRTIFDARELYPFKQMIKAGIPMIMTAHLHIPAFDPRAGLPSSLSRTVVTDLLQHELGFEGIVVTDGLRMKGISKQFNSGEAAVMAVLAGNDIIIDSETPQEAIEAVVTAVQNGVIPEERLNISVRKILRVKQWTGLDQYREPLMPTIDQFHSNFAYQLKSQLYSEAITIVKDKDTLLPVKFSTDSAALFIEDEKSALHKEADKTVLKVVSLEPLATGAQIAVAEVELMSFKTILIALFGMNKHAHKQFGIQPSIREFIERLQDQGKQVVLVLFGTPYAISLFDTLGTIIVAYEDDIDAQFAVARVILGRQKAVGQLPI